MRMLIILTLLIEANVLFGQDTAIVNKWKRATFAFEKFIEEQDGSSASTAIFLYHNNRHYLLTARHCIQKKDFDTVDTSVIDQVILIQNEESIADRQETMFGRRLLNLVIGKNMAWSSISNDVCVIDMDAIDIEFAKSLKRRGFVPVTLNDIDTIGTASNGEKVFMVGFPSEFTHMVKKSQYGMGINFGVYGNVAFMGVVTKGFIYESKKETEKIHVAILSLHGFSGSPLVNQHGVMVGLCSGKQVLDFYGEMKPGTVDALELEAKFAKLKVLPALLKSINTKPF